MTMLGKFLESSHAFWEKNKEEVNAMYDEVNYEERAAGETNG